MDAAIIPSSEVMRFAIVLFRVAGIIAFAPFFNIRTFPLQARVALVFTATMALFPTAQVGRMPQDIGFSTILILALTETLLGMVLGLAATFIFAGMQLAGQIASFQMGFSIINLIDPQSEVDMSVFSFLQNYIGILFFLMMNGHHWFFQAVNESFSILPVQGIHLSGPVLHEMLRLSSRMFLWGVQIASPVLVVTIITDIVLGVIGRAAPQINILIVGMPMKTLVGFACLGLTFYFLPQALGDAFAQLFQSLFLLMRAMS